MALQADGSLQLALLTVELFLLVATLLVLILNRREIRSRERLIRHFTSVADAITRQEYFVAVIESIQKAQSKIVGSVTGSMPSKEETDVVNHILDSLRDAVQRGVRARYLLPLAPDRIHMASKYVNAGAEVRFSPYLLVNDFRYTCIDNSLVVIGIPEKRGTNEPTRKGYVIPSENMAQLVLNHFEQNWHSSDTKSYESYLKEIIQKAKAANPVASPELIAAQLRIEYSELIRFYDAQ